jgi:uncharacterized protein (DUF2384 family)
MPKQAYIERVKRTSIGVIRPEKFKHWISAPNKSLNNKSPMSLLNTKKGLNLVIDLLHDVRHGVIL